jgi:predicted extracellular nuclease
MINKTATIIFFLFIFACSEAQKPISKFTVMFYNVENLFDTIDQPGVVDEEFLPSAEKQWISQRYNKKINDIARVIASVGDELPEIVGLAEVENLKVLQDLVNSSLLSSGNYGIVHEDSPDARGIDVALLYRKDQFRYLEHEKIALHFPFDPEESTRDILYVNGVASDGGDLHIFVNHWSSRGGGVEETEAKRMFAALSLRKRIDLLLARQSDPRIVIMGDFNDEPTNRSISGILQAGGKRKNISIGDLYNLHYDIHNEENAGSYNYQGNWNMLDQIIVSYNLINRKGVYSSTFNGGKIFNQDFLFYETKDGMRIPDRSYGGNEYFGGTSDHLPVYVVFMK